MQHYFMSNRETVIFKKCILDAKHELDLRRNIHNFLKNVFQATLFKLIVNSV